MFISAAQLLTKPRSDVFSNIIRQRSCLIDTLHIKVTSQYLITLCDHSRHSCTLCAVKWTQSNLPCAQWVEHSLNLPCAQWVEHSQTYHVRSE